MHKKHMEWWGSGGAAAPSLKTLGDTWLKNNAYVYLDFKSQLEASDYGDTVPSISNLGQTSTVISNVNTPKVTHTQRGIFPGQISAVNFNNDNGCLSLTNIGAIVSTSHEAHFKFSGVVNQSGNSMVVCGFADSGDNQYRFYFYQGGLRVIIESSGTIGGFVAASIFSGAESKQGNVNLRLRFDYGNELRLWVNGHEKTITKFTGSNFNVINNANFDFGSLGFYVGAYNANGTRTQNNVDVILEKFAITPLLTEEVPIVAAKFIETNENKIILHADTYADNILKNTAKVWGVCLAEAPTDDVTITPSIVGGNASVSGALTFTPANWMTPQNVTVTADNIAEPVAFRGTQLLLTASSSDTNFNGEVATHGVVIYGSEATAARELYTYQNSTFISGSTGAEILAKRVTLQDWAYPLGLPTKLYDTTEVWSSDGHNTVYASLTNLASGQRLKILTEDSQGYTTTEYLYVWRSDQTYSGKVVVLTGGHGDEAFTAAVNQFLATGIHVIELDMFNSGGVNGTDNPNIDDTTDTSAHTTMDVLDSAGNIDAFRQFTAQFISASNFAKDTDVGLSATKVVLTGNSGGAQLVNLVGAVADQDMFDAIFPCRGSMVPAQENPSSNVSTDYENAVTDDYTIWWGFLTSIMSKHDIWLINAFGGRRYVWYQHKDDTVVAGAEWSSEMGVVWAQLNGGNASQFWNPEAGESTHNFGPAEVTNMITEIGNL